MSAKTRLLFPATIAVALSVCGVAPPIRRADDQGDRQRPATPATAPRAYRRLPRRRRWPASPDIFTQYQLVFMRDGGRKPGVMAAVVKTLTDDKIRDLGA